jgi:hypothetical protein
MEIKMYTLTATLTSNYQWNFLYLNEVDPLQTLLLNKYNTYCPFVEFIQMGSLNVSMRIMIDFAEQKINC